MNNVLSRHPYASEIYSSTFRTRDTEVVPVPGWDTYVIVRPNRFAPSTATGLYPFASLAPACDLAFGVRHLKLQGISSLSLLTDPVWSPSLEALRRTFDSCRPFKASYLVDRRIGSPHIRKRHRNRINNAMRQCDVRCVSLKEHLDSWMSIYGHLVERKGVADNRLFGRDHFAHLSRLNDITAIAAFIGDDIAAMSLWIGFEDLVYFHLGASSEVGYRIFASYATHAHAMSLFADRRVVVLGPGAGLGNSPGDGLAEFKRGFSNAVGQSYLCSVVLSA